MSLDDELKAELAEEERIREDEYHAKMDAARKEEILQLKRIEFERPILEFELIKHLIPYLQEHTGHIRFVIDPKEEKGKINGELAKGDYRIKLSFIHRYNGHNCHVYSAIDLYPSEDEELSDPIIEGMRNTRSNITEYFRKAGVIGKNSKDQNFHDRNLSCF